MVSSAPRHTLPPGKTQYPFYRRLGGSQGRSGRAENLVPTGIRSQTVQPVAQSLYRLSYRAHIWKTCVTEMYKTFKGPTDALGLTPLATLLPPWSRVLLLKLTGSQLVKNLPAFYGPRRSINAFTCARHLSLSQARSIHSMALHPTSILILPFHLRLGLPSGLFPSGFPTKTLYTLLLSRIRATCPAHFILDFIT